MSLWIRPCNHTSTYKRSSHAAGFRDPVVLVMHGTGAPLARCNQVDIH